MKITIRVNGKPRSFDVEPNTLLLNLIRENMMLTGAKYGCGVGECGACTVLLDGESVLACMILAVDADGRNLETIEGLGEYDSLAAGDAYGIAPGHDAPQVPAEFTH